MQLADDHKVFLPRTVNDCLNILKRRPEAKIAAGATILSLMEPQELEDHEIISLHYIEELKRVFWSDRSVDIGSMVSLEKLLDLDDRIIPQGLREGTGMVADPQVRSLATVGGNIMASTRYLSLLSIMQTYDARFELRRSNGNRWIPAARFFSSSGEPDLEQDEIITRIRIPLGRWNRQKVLRLEISNNPKQGEFMFCAAAGVQSQSIEDLRTSYAFPGALILQPREQNAMVIGKNLPLQEKLISQYQEELIESLGLPAEYNTGFITNRIMKISGLFLRSLGRRV